MSAKPTAIWRKRAAALAERLPRERLHPATLAWAERSLASERWVVAFSGGADSLALLLLLWAHWPERRRRMRAVHFNHRLRGAAADADERFCREVCRSLGIPCRTGRWRKAPAKASEAEARAARQRFFALELAKAETTALWLGHQRDDIAETMLMRLARGSGPGGLCAPRPVQPATGGRVNLRPLLTLTKAELAAALRGVGARWRDDATNVAATYFRNRVRAEVVPVWVAAAGRDALAGAALSRELIEEDDRALEQWLSELAPVKKNGALSLRRIGGKPRGLVRRALYQWLGRRCEKLSRQAFEALLDDVLRGRRTRHSLGADEFAEIRRTQAVFVKSAPGRKFSSGFQRAVN